ncbi:MAG: hypothetical protein HKN41_05025 [Ilumatobacter sp.]|nr:hypothetical protein [Ilumatobacter sp.]
MNAAPRPGSAGAVDGDGTTRSVALVVLGCVLFTIALFVPVMQWSVSVEHETDGNARIWFGDGWTLADAGFQGAGLLPFASAAVVPLAVLAAATRSRPAWRVQVALAVVVAYVPLWTALAFARKWEDDVGADLGVGVLMAAFAALASGLWLGRPPHHTPVAVATDDRRATGSDLP